MLRFAPTPTRDMHIGDLRVAILNQIISKQQNKELIIRIDDTDKDKNIEGKDKEILELLNLFSIDYSRVVNQSENIKYHVNMGMKLLLDRKAFNCFCSNEALEQDKQKAKDEGKDYSYSGFCQTISDETKFNCNAPFVVRLAKPEQNIKFTDKLKGKLSYTPDQVDSFVLLNLDKTPTYNFACAIDDMLYDISTIIRGQDNLENTPKQIHLRESLGYTKEIEYIHIPNTTNNITVKSLIDDGYLPAAIANYIVTLGYETPKEIFTLEEAIEWFDISKLSNEEVKFDIERLNKLNKEYINSMDELRLSKILGYADNDIGKLAKLYLQECNTIKQIKSKIDVIFQEKVVCSDFNEEYQILKECLIKAPFINNFDDLVKQLEDQTQFTNAKIEILLKFALTGTQSGPDIKEIYSLTKNYLGEIVK